MTVAASPPDAPDTSAPDLGGVDPTVYARRGLILATMCLSLVLIVATVSSVNVAIPSLGKSALRPSDTQILWIVDAYALVFAAFLLPAGSIGDRFGRKGALLVGLTIFAVFSALCAVMHDTNLLIACRAAMGVGAALIMPSTLSLLQSSFPPKERPKAIATWAGFAGAGGAIGPLVGGLLLAHFWYGSVFLVAAPLAIVAFVASWLLAPKSREATAPALDLGGAALSILGFGALLASIIEGPEEGWGNPLVIAGFLVAAASLAGFVVYERHAEHPMLDMQFFRKRRFSGGALGVTFTFLSMFSLFFVLTQYLQYVLGYSALGAGVRGLPFAVMMVAVSPRSVALVHRYGIRPVVGVGIAFVAIGLLVLSAAQTDSSYLLVAVALVIAGAGVALATPSLTTGILQSVPMNKAGVGSAVNDTTREVGGAVGIAVIGSIVTSIYRSHVGSALGSLPPELAALARRNPGAAIEVASRIADQAVSDALQSAVRQSFVDGMHLGLRVSAATVVIAGVVVVARLPSADAVDGRAEFGV